ncbi:MAG: hypothetical protein KKG75_01270 [Nanoarchaeota archaeon]|nr:hypothetical protein [Nanoarchaeota archaeon]
MGIFRTVVESILGPIASTADLQRFGKWKKDLEDALAELEKKYKKKKLSKAEYIKRKTELEKKLKKAEELIKKSKERFEKTSHKEIRL